MHRSRHFADRLMVLTLVLALFPAGAVAQGLYDVEIIVFTHNAGPDRGEFMRRPGDAAGQAGGQFTEGRFTELSASRYRLGPVRYSLQQDGAYSVLFHRAWRQVASRPSRVADYPVHSFSGDRSLSVEGAVSLIRGRYLHLDIDLVLMKTLDSAPGQYSDGPGNVPAFRLQEKRRIRSSELHYFDHPRFGLLAMVTPYRAPAPAVTDAPAEPDTAATGAGTDNTAADPPSP